MKYYIHQAKVGLSEGGLFIQCVVASVLFSKDDGEHRWLHCVEVEGIPCFYLNGEDAYESLIEEDDEVLERMNDESWVQEIDGFPLGEYDRIFQGLEEQPDNPCVPLIRYVIALVRLDMAESLALAKLADGREVDSIPIPETDLDVDYREGCL